MLMRMPGLPSPPDRNQFFFPTQEYLRDEERYRREYAVYSEKDEAWEREFQREKLALVREQEAQARRGKAKTHPGADQS